MKKIVIVLSMALILISCSSGPESVAKNFTENLAKAKTEEAKKYATESTGQLIDFASSMGSLPVEPNFEFEMLSDSIEGDKAWIIYINQEGKEETIELVKIDGEWKVHLQSKK